MAGEEEGREMARGLVEWVERWQAGVAQLQADGEPEKMNGNGVVEGEVGRLLN